MQAEIVAMKITVILKPPYLKKGEKAKSELELQGGSISANALAALLQEQWKPKLGYPFFDRDGRLTVEFFVNGKHAHPDTIINSGDEVIIIPYICGG